LSQVLRPRVEPSALLGCKSLPQIAEAELALAVGVGWNRRQQVVNADALRAGELVKLEERAEADALLVMRQHLFLRDAKLVRNSLSDLVRALPVLGPFARLLLLARKLFRAAIVCSPETAGCVKDRWSASAERKRG